MEFCKEQKLEQNQSNTWPTILSWISFKSMIVMLF